STVKTSGVSEPWRATRRFWPVEVPSVQVPAAATPFASVVALVLVILPPPAVTSNVTSTPGTGRCRLSVTRTVGLRELPTTALEAMALAAVIVDGTGGPEPPSEQAAAMSAARG